MLDVVAPGLLTTVQDLGRHGYRHLGVPSGGAADRDALRVANVLVGNDEGDAGLEFTLLGATLRLRRPRVVALTGGECEVRCSDHALPMWRPVALRAGAEIEIARIRRGARAYLAVAGGIGVPQALGSRSTDLRASYGGHEGRALRARDRLPLGHDRGVAAHDALWHRLESSDAPFAAAPWWVAPTEDLRGDTAMLHLLPGKDVRTLDPRVLRALRDGIWTVGADSDRMGLRFDGPPIPHVPYADRVSEPVLPGAIQLPPDGRPIVLGVDAQTVGGYPVIAQVIRADMNLTMQLKPGDRVRPVLVTPEAAESAWFVRQRDFARMREALAWRVRR